MNFSEKIVIHTRSEAWQDSPSALVKRIPLEREAAESGHTTSLVLYKAGASFESHYHPLGEEIFVLSGEFKDEHGAYPKYSWLRSHHLSSHNPWVDEETIILVKTGHLNV